LVHALPCIYAIMVGAPVSAFTIGAILCAMKAAARGSIGDCWRTSGEALQLIPAGLAPERTASRGIAAERTERGDPAWQGFLQRNEEFGALQSQANKILLPAAFSPLK
jgi:hypothetical protein